MKKLSKMDLESRSNESPKGRRKRGEKQDTDRERKVE